MTGDVLILRGSSDSESSRRLSSIVNFMGLTPFEMPIDKQQGMDNPADNGSCIFVSADTLTESSADNLQRSSAPVLVYGFHPCRKHTELVSKLSNGHLSGPEAVIEESEYAVSEDADKSITGYFSGLRFGPINGLLDSTYSAAGTGAPPAPLVSIDGDSFFIRCGKTDSGHGIYLLGTAGIADINRITNSIPSAASLFSSLICFMLFIRSTCGMKCRLPVNPYACLIIDDPLLRPQYGFVNYKKLLDDMQKHNYAVSISHVPRNSAMTEKSTAKLFAENKERLSICVHGCDHVRGEFATEDEQVLHKLSSTALALMSKHEADSGVVWDRVMVFPHGRFSAAALKVLKEYGITAAVVSVDAVVCGRNPTGSRAETHHKLTEFLSPAVTAYGGIPLFLRRYPKHPEDFAFDLLLGRPLIITTHHQDFKDGASELNSFIDRLNVMEPELKWVKLAIIADECTLAGGRPPVDVIKPDGAQLQTDSTLKSKFAYAVRRQLMITRDNLSAWKERDR